VGSFCFFLFSVDSLSFIRSLFLISFTFHIGGDIFAEFVQCDLRVFFDPVLFCPLIGPFVSFFSDILPVS